MKFLLDENIGKSIAQFLTQFDYTIFRVRTLYPGLADLKVLELAVEKDAVLITLDKDYGELVFRESKTHTGVIFLRLENQTSSNIKKVISWFLSIYPQDKIKNSFTVITERAGKFKARITS